MTAARRYEGPLRPGMEYRYGDTRMVAVLTKNDIANYEETIRTKREMVRPADDDTQAWALFVPDGSLPNTGPKQFKVGQVWALGCDATQVWRTVFRIVSVGEGNADQWIEVTTLAGDRIVSISNTMFTNRTVLLFDVPEAKPAERQLTRGWTRATHPTLDHCGCYGCGAQGRRRYSLATPPVGSLLFCELCAEVQGAFDASIKPSLMHPAQGGGPGTSYVPVKMTVVKARVYPPPRCGVVSCKTPESPLAVRVYKVGTATTCDACYLASEREKAVKTALVDGAPWRAQKLPARVGTAPQVVSVGVGIWASRGMRW